MLADIPKRLCVVHRDDAIQYRRPVVPGSRIAEVRTHKGGDVADRAGDEVGRDYIPNHHVAFRFKLPTATLLDPN